MLLSATADACELMGLLICLHLETPWGPLSERHVHVLMPPEGCKASVYDPKKRIYHFVTRFKTRGKVTVVDSPRNFNIPFV